MSLRPTFVLSLDTELIWGSFDHTSPARFGSRYPGLRPVIRALVTLLEDLEIAATWAVVGHLFLDSCPRGADGRAHPDLPRPRLSWYPGDWFSEDPCTDRSCDPLWYGDDLVDLVLGASVTQEMASHSFSHVPYGDPGCPAEVVEADLTECTRLAAARGLSLRSFVFPRNSEGHHSLLRDHGFTAYRGRDETWFRSLSGSPERVARLVDQAAALDPPVSTPSETLPGLWNIPGSMVLIERRGVRALIPIAQRVAKGSAGLARAVREGKVFHLWLHPFNLSRHSELMLGGLGDILRKAARLRDEGTLDIATMGSLAAALSTPSA